MRIIYLRPYQKLVWDYKNANTSLIQKSLNMINWNKFSKGNFEKRLNILNDTHFNVFPNFVRIKVDDKDPPWINEEIKCKIKSKSKIFQQLLKSGRKVTDF